MTTLTVGDTSPALTGQALSAESGVILTGSTLALHIRRADNTVLTVAAVIVNGGTGTWSYDWAVGDLSVAGRWQVELQVTYSGGRIETFGPASFNVRAQIA